MRVTSAAHGAPRECLRRSPRFWGVRPRLTAGWLPVEVCGVRLTSLGAGSCDSAIEALCSEGKTRAAAPRVQLTRLLAAAKLSQRATGTGGGYCGSAIEQRVAQCEALCEAEPEVLLASGCLEDLKAFGTAADTFLSPPAPFDQPAELEPEDCAAARRNTVVPGFGACRAANREEAAS